MVEKYFSVRGKSESETVIERSRFICTVARIEGEEDAKNFIESIKKRYSDATHNCYAYVASEDGNIMKFSDDGEPQGTAGLPMLEVLRAREIRMTAAVVTRYFGGIKLGAGGLVRAYSGAVAEALDGAEIVSNELSDELKIGLGYDIYSAFLKFAAGRKMKILSTDFGEKVAITCVLPRVLRQTFESELSDLLLGRVEIANSSSYFYHFEKL